MKLRVVLLVLSLTGGITYAADHPWKVTESEHLPCPQDEVCGEWMTQPHFKNKTITCYKEEMVGCQDFVDAMNAAHERRSSPQMGPRPMGSAFPTGNDPDALLVPERP